jgi:hypothetical protein
MCRTTGQRKKEKKKEKNMKTCTSKRKFAHLARAPKVFTCAQERQTSCFALIGDINGRENSFTDAKAIGSAFSFWRGQTRGRSWIDPACIF